MARYVTVFVFSGFLAALTATLLFTVGAPAYARAPVSDSVTIDIAHSYQHDENPELEPEPAIMFDERPGQITIEIDPRQPLGESMPLLAGVTLTQATSNIRGPSSYVPAAVRQAVRTVQTARQGREQHAKCTEHEAQQKKRATETKKNLAICELDTAKRRQATAREELAESKAEAEAAEKERAAARHLFVETHRKFTRRKKRRAEAKAAKAAARLEVAKQRYSFAERELAAGKTAEETAREKQRQTREQSDQATSELGGTLAEQAETKQESEAAAAAALANDTSIEDEFARPRSTCPVKEILCALCLSGGIYTACWVLPQVI